MISKEDRQPCRRNVGNDPLGWACKDCGHTGMVHPFTGNRVEACAICELHILRDELKKLLDTKEDR